MTAKKKAAPSKAPKTTKAHELDYTSTVTSHGGTRVTKTKVTVEPSADVSPGPPKSDEERARNEARRLEYEG